jgi:nucleoside 2-deoxyribosyltransferase
LTDYTVISKYRNKNQCELLVKKLQDLGKTCFNFCEVPADPNNPEGNPEEQMDAFESVSDFYNDEYYQYVFKTDLNGLKNADIVIMLLPAGNSVHLEAGIAYGLGKPLILIGKPEKPESLYLIFKERYKTIEEFLQNIE